MSDAQRRVHEAIADLLDEGEIAICWVLTIDVAGQDSVRYLAHRAGGGVDGDDNPMAWTALGMLQSSARLAEDQVVANMGNSMPGDDEAEPD